MARAQIRPFDRRGMWIEASVRVIGVCGRKGHGKDTVGAMVYGAAPARSHVFKLAEPMRNLLTALGVDPDDKTTPIAWLGGVTARHMLQTLGTEWGRSIHPDLWVLALMKRIDERGVGVAIITDVRFPNEAAAVRARGGVIWKVVRPGMLEDEHASEASVDLVEADETIVNDGSLADLLAKVDFLLAKYRACPMVLDPKPTPAVADLDLARRAVECPGWRWVSGMRALLCYRDHPCAPVADDRMGHIVAQGGLMLSAYRWMGVEHDPLPDLDDEATRGALLGLVRELWPGCMLAPFATHDFVDGDSVAVIWYRLERVSLDMWCALQREPVRWPGSDTRYIAGATEAEALVAALEAAHG